VADGPSTLDAAAIRAQLGAPYERFDAAGRERHAQLLARITEPTAVAVHVDRDPASATTSGEAGREATVTVCSADTPGVLSLITGLFAAHRINVRSADIFTLDVAGDRPSEPPARPVQRGAPRSRRTASAGGPERRVLDVFELSEPPGAPAELWEEFEARLDELTDEVAAGRGDSARDEVIELVSESARRAAPSAEQLYPLAIDVGEAPDARYTELRIRSTDTLGFLFEFTNALAVLGINVERAQVRTVGRETRDTFWVTDRNRRPITEPARLDELRATAALIKQFTHLLPRSPDPGQALRQFSALTAQLMSRPGWTAQLRDLESGEVLATLARLMGVSRFLWEDFLRMQHESLFPLLTDSPALERRRAKDELAAELAALLAAETDGARRAAALNVFKDREMFRIDVRHLTRGVDVREFSAELSDLAEVVVDAAGRLAAEQLAVRHGTPRTASGDPCTWAACALGKLGGREIGFASDSELLFVYAEDGESDGAEPLPNARYFEQLVRAFRSIVIARQEGIFEIDLRLRPHGEAGPLASSLPGLAAYLAPAGGPAADGATDGEGSDGAAGEAGPKGPLQFERMALVRLRAIAGDRALGAEVERLRDAFVYSGAPLNRDRVRYLRERQASELVAEGALNAKYSPGGVVDIEYFVQARQIEAGASDPSVRVPGTIDAIERLTAAGELDAARSSELVEAYRFLRRLIDALRMVRGNARDLTLPEPESRAEAYLARRLELEGGAELRAALAERMAVARALWAPDSATER
jgi:glutamate-ammonia-ligase adenylyltransferase